MAFYSFIYKVTQACIECSCHHTHENVGRIVHAEIQTSPYNDESPYQKEDGKYELAVDFDKERLIFYLAWFLVSEHIVWLSLVFGINYM